MKKYIVKIVSTATAENKNFAGEVHTYWNGKNDTLLGADAGTWLQIPLYNGMIKENGYSRLCDAKRNWGYRNPQNDKNWTTEVEIVEVEL